MSRRPVPRRGTVTMSLVESIEENRNLANVLLVQFDKKATLAFSDQQREEIQVGRMVPVVVGRVRLERKNQKSALYIRFLRKISSGRLVDIRCSMEGLNPENRSLCDVRFTEFLHVKEILSRVARNTDLPLKRIYELTHWPSRGDLLNNDSNLWISLRRDLAADVMNQLVTSIQKVWYQSFRLTHNRCLSSARLVQSNGYCYAISLIRHYEFLLKINGLLEVDLSLSIQDFINHLPPGMEDAEDRHCKVVAGTLMDHGVLVEPFGGDLTFIRVPPVEREDWMLSFTPHNVEYQLLHGWNQAVWNDDIKIQLAYGPVAASFVWFTSYNENPGNVGDVLRPTPQEEAAYIAHPPQVPWPMHSGFITGYGTDSNGNDFWECQDSYGDVNNGDRGYFRLAITIDPIYVSDYVIIQHDEDEL